MNILRNRLFLAVALGHTTIDVFNSAGPVLIAFLSVSMGLSNAQIGLTISLYALLAAARSWAQLGTINFVPKLFFRTKAGIPPLTEPSPALCGLLRLFWGCWPVKPQTAGGGEE